MSLRHSDERKKSSLSSQTSRAKQLFIETYTDIVPTQGIEPRQYQAFNPLPFVPSNGFRRQVPRRTGRVAVCSRPSLVSKPFTPVARCHWPALSWGIMASRKAYTPKPSELFCLRPCRRHPFLSGRALNGSYIAEPVPRVDNLFLCRIEKRLFLSQYVKELMSLRTVRCALIQHVPVAMQEAHLGLLW